MVGAARRGGFFFGLRTVLLVWSGALATTGALIGTANAADNGAPTITRVSEGLFGSHTGEQKKESAISFVAAALQLTESVSNREIVDEAKFKEGLSKIIDGTVQCLNASSWAKAGVQQ
jgi:hypothetical protein